MSNFMEDFADLLSEFEHWPTTNYHKSAAKKWSIYYVIFKIHHFDKNLPALKN
jgi:hypothetical protein